MAKKIELIFKNLEGRNITLSLDDPIEPVDNAKVTAAMDEIISANAFLTSGGPLVSKHQARIVERNVSGIEIN